MARYLQFVVRAFSVGAIIVIVAIVSRQVYLLNVAEAGTVGAEQEPATKMLIRCETMHSRLHNRHSSADTADADEQPRARCRES
ncbi:hypothetical protein DN412_27090 [Cupriavidus lacunae]|uniref:Uncharacterized protein n=1 Tax=Cupriavidus lacunae TaxID=2666307 RepID=A0A370NNQ2_9BURK|nr:hypothetical protein DN412_27090 [Cupriavidus lacunae]